LWFAEQAGNKIGRITIDGAITEYPVPTAGGRPNSIVRGPDGALWFTEMVGNKIGRITTAGIITEFPVPTAASTPIIIAAGPDGAMWFTENTGNKIGRITTGVTLPPTATPTATPTAGPGVGGKAFTVRSGPEGAILSWQGGTDESGYSLYRFMSGVFTPVANLGPNATGAIDPGAQGLTCYWLTALGTAPTRTSDFECVVMGQQTGAAPQEFTLRLNQNYTASLNWNPPANGQQDSYRLILVSGGTINLDGSATSVKVPVTGFACFTLQALRQGAIIGSTNGVCGIPNYSNLGF
jgi:hypothetical protein